MYIDAQKPKIEEKPIFAWPKDKESPIKKALLFFLFLLFALSAYFVYQKGVSDTRASFFSIQERIFSSFKEQEQESIQNKMSTDVNISENNVSSEFEASRELLLKKAQNIPEQNITESQVHIVETVGVLPEQNSSVFADKNSNLSSVGASIDKLSIKPRSKVWLGVIYLDSGQKVNRFIDSEYVIDKKREQLIVLGKGDINLTVNGTIKEYSSPNPIRFHFNGQEIKQISYDEFMEINGGKIW